VSSRVKLGSVAHFSLAVRDPVASAKWWIANFDLTDVRWSGDRVLLRNDAFALVLFRGEPSRSSLEHMAFNVSDVAALSEAAIVLRANGVDVEDGDDAIGSVAPGSSSFGLWFRDRDGYRWELFVR
jgi:catechol 2,3-dioxygenase-like lactoylglutathione lyase family enzyme